jgi:hypothetical protein
MRAPPLRRRQTKRQEAIRQMNRRVLAGLRRLFSDPVEVHADVSGFRSGIGKRNGSVEHIAGFFIASKLRQKGALDAEVMEISRELRGQWLDHCERRSRPANLGRRDRG